MGTPSSAIWCGLPYAVDNRCPHHIQPVVHGIYMVWGYAVGTHELYRCRTCTCLCPLCLVLVFFFNFCMFVRGHLCHSVLFWYLSFGTCVRASRVIDMNYMFTHTHTHTCTHTHAHTHTRTHTRTHTHTHTHLHLSLIHI